MFTQMTAGARDLSRTGPCRDAVPTTRGERPPAVRRGAFAG